MMTLGKSEIPDPRKTAQGMEQEYRAVEYGGGLEG